MALNQSNFLCLKNIIPMKILVPIACAGCILLSCQSRQKNDTVATENQTAVRDTNAEPKRKTIIFFGNSLTAAYGLDQISSGYVALLQQRLDSLGLPWKTVNAGLSGETTAGGKERVNWVLRQPVDVFVLELGGNDALRGIEPAASYDNLKAIIESVKAKYPASRIILAGMEAPPNMGQAYATAFRENYRKLAKEYGTSLIPFFLEGVGGVKELNQADGIHPNEAGQKILLENVWKVLEKVLRE
jgi:acyl-CoA thioesterase-1